VWGYYECFDLCDCCHGQFFVVLVVRLEMMYFCVKSAMMMIGSVIIVAVVMSLF